MFSVVDGYRGESREINEGLARLFTYARLVDEPWIFREIQVDGIKDMFKYSWYEPKRFGMVIYEGPEGKSVVAASWVTPSELGKPHAITPYINPYLPKWLVKDVLEALLSWCRYVLEREGILGIAKIYVDLEGGYLHRLVKEYLSVGGIEGTSATIMKLGGVHGEAKVPSGYLIREANEGDYRGIAEVHNKAFSKYEAFVAWSEDDVRRFYEYFRRHFKFKVLVAEELSSGKVVGFCDGGVFKALDGELSADVTTVAVDPEHQGKGLGRALVLKMVNELMKLGSKPERTYLISIHDLEPFYASLGFRVYKRLMYILTPIQYLPKELKNYRPFT